MSSYATSRSDWGLSFSEARKLILSSVVRCLRDHEEHLARCDGNGKMRQEIHLYLTLPSLFCVLLFIVSLGLGIPNGMISGERTISIVSAGQIVWATMLLDPINLLQFIQFHYDPGNILIFFNKIGFPTLI